MVTNIMAEDFRVHVSFRNSRKRRRLKRKLGSDGVLALIDLWAYAAQERPDGLLFGLDADDIADELGWDGDAQCLVDALVSCGLLDVTDNGDYALHDWAERQPWVSSSNARTEGAKKAAHERWASKGACKGGTPYCDERCISKSERSKNNDLCGTHANALRNHANRNAPNPNPNPNPTPNPNPNPPPIPSHDQSDQEQGEDFCLNGILGMVPSSWGKAGNGALAVLHSVRPSHELWRAVVAEVGAKPRKRPWGYATKILPQRSDAARFQGPQSPAGAILAAPECQYKGIDHWTRLGAKYGLPAPTAAEHERLLSLDGQGTHVEPGIVAQIMGGANTWVSAMNRFDAEEKRTISDAIAKLKEDEHLSLDFNLPYLDPQSQSG